MLRHRLSTLCSKSNSFSKKHSTLSCVSWEINMLPYHSVCAPSSPLSIPPLSFFFSLFFYVFVGKSLLVRLPHRQQAHTHTHKRIVCELGPVLASLFSHPVFPACPVCLFVCGPNALNFYFRLSQFTQANGKKYFSFGWLAALPGLPFINRPELRIKLCTWRVCLLLLCIRYVMLRIRNVLHGLHGVIDKVKFRTFAANFCGRLLWF